jgi:type IV pilus assembly protein PilY1
VAIEYCSDANLSDCKLQSAPSGIYTNPAPVRFCRNQTDATSTSAVGDPVGTAVPKCISKYVSQSGITAWKFARYGQFKRTDLITPSQSATWNTITYAGRPGRVDCAAAPVCSADEELTNYANWYAYYRTRILMMKTATGAAFQALDDRYRIGFITIHPGSPVTSSKFLPVKAFDNTQKQAFFNILYSQDVGQATPLREALSRAGRYFANKRTGINNGINDDPMEYSCQQNFVLLTTDGYWNTGDPVDINGTNMANTNVDNADVNPGTTPPSYSARSNGVFDGGAAVNAKGTLADTALYFYKTDLRDASLNNCTSGATGADVCKNNVPTSTRDPNPNQHLSLFTLGLVDGLLKYQTDYDTSLTGDFARIKSGNTGCFWAGGTCNWPLPVADGQSALDDLWHAAVNGRGKYFFARDPNSLSDGLGSALSNVISQTAAAAAAATSTPNVTPTDNFVFSTTYRTAKWDGEVIARRIDVLTGAVLPGIVWQAQGQLDALSPASRTIKYRSSGGGLVDFNFGGLNATLQGYFQGQGNKLSQWTTLTAPQRTTVDNGTELVNFLRGDKTFETDLFRVRDHILGDTVNATPAYVATPQFNFGDAVTPAYSTFKSTSRTPALYVGANDGMLHALHGSTGQEMWAYVPTMVMPKMYILADTNYGVKHTYFVDGSPTVMDAHNGSAWRTILVAGLNGGGRGYYALDITDPNNPTSLWEWCSDSTLCANNDSDIGFTYGNPIITKRKSDGTWVAIFTSGYNNTLPGDGVGHLYVVNLFTGALLNKINTGAGDTTTPSGLAKITAMANNFDVDNTALFVYGGDMLGNVWKVDMASASPTAVKIAHTGANQPITTKPEVTKIGNDIVLYVATGAYLGVTDLATTAPQTVYAFKDTNADIDLRGSSGIVSNTASVSGTTVTIGKTTTVDWTNQLGWRVDLPQSGERVNIDPILAQGNLLVASNIPDTDACNAGGESFFYAFQYDNPRAPTNTLNGTQLGVRIGSAVAVGLTAIKLPSGVVKALLPLADTTIQTQGPAGLPPLTTPRRVGWRQLRVQ